MVTLHQSSDRFRPVSPSPRDDRNLCTYNRVLPHHKNKETIYKFLHNVKLHIIFFRQFYSPPAIRHAIFMQVNCNIENLPTYHTHQFSFSMKNILPNNVRKHLTFSILVYLILYNKFAFSLRHPLINIHSGSTSTTAISGELLNLGRIFGFDPSPLVIIISLSPNLYLL